MDTTKDIKYKLHKIIKRTEIFLIVLALPLFFTGLQSVKGALVVAGVESHVTAQYGEELYSFYTYKTRLIDAVNEQGLTVYDQDGFSVDRETKLNGGKYTVNITKSLPVLINDNGDHKVGRTIFTDAREIVEQNNIEIFEEDVVESELIIDPVSQNGAGQIITITRAPVYNVIRDNKLITARTWETKVEDILAYINLEYDEMDYIDPALDVLVENGDTIVVSKERDVEIVETEIINHQTKYSNDYYTQLGREVLVTSGVDGQRELRYRVTYRSGKQISKVLLSSKTTKNPTTAVIKKGLMPSSNRNFKRIYWNLMVTAGTKYGVSPLDLFNVASCESRVNPDSVNGAGYYGMYQYNLGFWSTASSFAGYGGASVYNAEAQIFSTAKWVSKYGWGRWGCKP